MGATPRSGLWLAVRLAALVAGRGVILDCQSCNVRCRGGVRSAHEAPGPRAPGGAPSCRHDCRPRTFARMRFLRLPQDNVGVTIHVDRGWRSS